MFISRSLKIAAERSTFWVEKLGNFGVLKACNEQTGKSDVATSQSSFTELLNEDGTLYFA
jgi:hypothetical protein